METALAVMAGIGLSAACGFRIFVPLLVMSIASLSGHLTLAPGFQWIGTYPALIAFSVATAVEVAGYYVPWVDHLLDTISTPAAIIAGTIVTASLVTGLSPFMKWTLAIIAGGGAAGLVQGTTVAVRGLSTASTGGLGNPFFATIELGGSLITSIVSVLIPWLGVLFIGALMFVVGKKILTKSPKPVPVVVAQS